MVVVALLLLQLLRLSTARVIGITSDMESKFSPAFINVLQQQAFLTAQHNRNRPPSEPAVRVSMSA
eukprot:COSAG06_NODE_47796_length_336_cov_13.181435_1_plen_65_part_10